MGVLAANSIGGRQTIQEAAASGRPNACQCTPKSHRPRKEHPALPLHQHKRRSPAIQKNGRKDRDVSWRRRHRDGWKKSSRRGRPVLHSRAPWMNRLVRQVRLLRHTILSSPPARTRRFGALGTSVGWEHRSIVPHGTSAAPRTAGGRCRSLQSPKVAEQRPSPTEKSVGGGFQCSWHFEMPSNLRPFMVS